MNTKMALRLFAILLLVGFTLSATIPALADAPTFDKVVLDIYYDPPDANCGFPVIAHMYGTRTDIVHVSGDYSHVQEIWGQLELEYMANGKNLKGRIQGPVDIRITDTTFTYSEHGTGALVIVPGYGPVKGQAGNLFYEEVYDPVTGDLVSVTFTFHGLMTEYDWAPICEYLAP